MTKRIQLSQPKHPSVPRVRTGDPTLQRAHDAIKETIETMRGNRGDIRDRAMFVRDLVDLGILSLSNGTIGTGTAIPPLDPNGENDATTPPGLDNISVTAGFSNVLITWNDPHFHNLAYYEIWRRTLPNDAAEDPAVDPATLRITQTERDELYALYTATNLTGADERYRDALASLDAASTTYDPNSVASKDAVRSSRTLVSAALADDVVSALRVGVSKGPIYSDPVDRGRSYLYWVRAVSNAGVVGPFNARGELATTQPDIEAIMKQLTAEINNSTIAQWILHGIDISGEGWGASATLGDSFVQQNAWVNNVDSGWGVRVGTTAGGKDYVAGFGLNLNINAEGEVVSTFLVAADRFAVVDPDSLDEDEPGVAPFIIAEDPNDPGVMKVWINTAMIIKASILELIAGSVTADYLQTTVALDAPHINLATINIGSIDKHDSTDPTDWTWSADAGRQGNFSVDEDGIMHATTAILRSCTIYDENGDVILDSSGNMFSNSIVNTNNPIDASNIGTFIANLAVNALYIQGNTVTVPVAATWAGSKTLSSSYQSLVSLAMEITELGLGSVDNDIPVMVQWFAEATAQNSDAVTRRFRVRQTTGSTTTTIYESNSNMQDKDQYSSGIVKTTIDAGAEVTWVLEAMGHGNVFQTSLFAMAVRR